MTTMNCEHVHAELLRMAECTPTDEGLRFTTHVMYPSFEPVMVYISGHGEGFRVHDGGGAIQSAWDHGRDSSVSGRAVTRHANLNALENVEGRLVASIPTADWLMPAILTVANASAAAALDAVDREVKSERTLAERIEEVLRAMFAERSIAKDYEVSGRSGKRYRFDFAIRDAKDGWTLVDGISPHPTSIAAKYVAFSDTRGEGNNLRGRFAIYEHPLEDDDAALMQQVAALLPFASLKTGLHAEVGR